MIPQRSINCENVKEMSNPTRDGRAMIAAGMIHVTIGAVRVSNRPANSGGSQNSPQGE